MADSASKTPRATIPNLLVKIPHGTYPGDSRKALLKAIHDVVNDVEQMGDSPKNPAVTWIVIEELQISAFSAGGVSMLLLEMPESQWGAGDTIWRLPDVTAAAGFRHLQSLVVPR